MDAASAQKVSAFTEWVNTFDAVGDKISSLEELCDGVVLCDILCHIAPDIFSAENVTRSNLSNWAILLTNLKKLVKNLDLFFREHLQLQADVDDLDLSSISRERDVGELVKLLELVLVAAIRSSERAHFVGKIMELSQESQVVLKDAIESAMHRTRALDEAHGTGASAEELEEMRVAIRRTEDENSKLRQEVDALKGRLAKAADEEEVLNQMLAQQNKELDTQRKRGDAAEHQFDELRSLYDSTRLKLAERDGDTEHLKSELDRLKERSQSDKEKVDVLEAANRRMADELDVARAKAAEVAKLEATIEKYKQKLDQAATAKQHMKDLEEQNSKYLDQIMSLEDEVKTTIPALRKTIEQYKEKQIQLEREKFKATEGVQLRDAEIAKLREEIDAAHDAKRFLTDELVELRRLQAEGLHESQHDMGFMGLTEGSITDLKEKLARLERENKTLKKQLEGGAGTASTEVVALTCQLQDSERLREEREQEVIEAKKRLMDLEGALKKLREHTDELEDQLAVAKAGQTAGHASTKEMMEQLRARLKEEEQMVLTLRAEKEKLEQFTKRTFQDVQQRYVQTLEGLKNQNLELKERNKFLEDRLAKDKAAQKREEKLLVSAIYELGLEIIESRIQAPEGGIPLNTMMQGSGGPEAGGGDTVR